jgi:hypothetical protein
LCTPIDVAVATIGWKAKRVNTKTKRTRRVQCAFFQRAFAKCWHAKTNGCATEFHADINDSNA